MLEVIGVRHWSPACARLVRARIQALQPRWVLIEGPSDFNPRLAELALPHTLPIALYSYYGNDAHTSSCHAPFAEFAPEWVALKTAFAAGIGVRFIDLPYWHPGARELPQRYTLRTLPGRERYSRVQAALQRQCGVDGDDALWDHLFEREADAIGVDATATAQLQQALDHYFDALRADEAGAASDQAREAHMRAWICWALRTGGAVLVVCGGWHRRALTEPAPAPAHSATEPMLAAPADSPRHGSFLVPYGERQLDAYSGYGAGMPSPLWYRWQWQEGTAAAAHKALRLLVQSQRSKAQPLSTAQLVQARLRVQALACLRGHPQPLRSDLLDGVLDALVDSALEEAPPWHRRALPGRHVDPRLRAALLALAGDGRGRLAEGTPQPPLVADVAARRALLDLLVTGLPRSLTLDRRQSVAAERACVLWQLRVFALPGVVLEGLSASTGARHLSSDQYYSERWLLRVDPHQDSALIEAGAWGATLPEAAARRIEADAALATPAQLLEAVQAALRCGFDALGARLAQAAGEQLAHSTDWSALAKAAQRLAALSDAGFWGRQLDALLAPLLELLDGRLAWLLEARSGADPAHASADIDAVRFLARGLMAADPDRQHSRVALLARRARDPLAPPALAGAAAGALWRVEDPALASGFDEAAIIAAARRLPQAEQLGDWLGGLFALARQAVVDAPALVAALDQLVVELDEADFLRALPALRQAFHWLPPRERARLAARLAGLHGGGGALAAHLLAAADPASMSTQGPTLEAALDAMLERYGLRA